MYDRTTMVLRSLCCPVASALALAVLLPAQSPKLECSVVGASVSKGLSWSDYEAFSPDPDPLTFAERHLGRQIEEREYDLRTAGVGIARILSAISDPKTTTVRDYSNIFVFTKPAALVGGQVRNASRRTPLAIGLDLLLWCGYGQVPSSETASTDEERASHRASFRLDLQQRAFDAIDKGLKGGDCLLVVGDYPDLSGVDPLVVPASAQPTPSVRAQLNESLAKWAAARNNVLVYPIADVLERAKRGALEVELSGKTVMLHTEQVLQFDEIHPNSFGAAFLVHDLARWLRGAAPDVATALPQDTSYAAVLRRIGADPADLVYLKKRARTR